MKIPKSYTCHKVKNKQMIVCSKKHKKIGRHSGKRTSPKRTRGARMRMAKKRAAKMPGGKGPVSKRPAGRKILKH